MSGILICTAIGLSAQNTPEWRDSIPEAVKTGYRKAERKISELKTDMTGMRNVVSPLGEGDPVRWVQSLPGVTTGADGSSAIYVRGGNMGNNLFSMDGVQVYGYSHILGITTIIPQGVIEGVTLVKSSFDGSGSNFTSSHLKVDTKTPDLYDYRVSAAVNNFLVGAEAEVPLAKNLSMLVSGRISPLTYEYKAAKSLLPDFLGTLDDFNADVWDLYGKLYWRIGSHNSLELSGMGSRDLYSFVTPAEAFEKMGWDNTIGLLKYKGRWSRTSVDASVSYNNYSSLQYQEAVFRGEPNVLSLRSGVEELSAGADVSRKILKCLEFSTGARYRHAFFDPGQVASVSNRSEVDLASAYLTASFSMPGLINVQGTVKGNYFRNAKYQGKSILPEGSVSLKWDICGNVSLQAAYDRTLQYYHTLEGLPVGWSLDMIVPSGGNILPESADQFNIGVEMSFGRHDVSVGGFYKTMDNLVYYKDSHTMFSGSLAAWESGVDFGKGRSKGLELMYEYHGQELSGRLAYTLSWTDRHGFVEINGGRPFHARFDRRHVLNATVQWKGLSASFITQSGHWENGAPQTYEMHIPGTTWEARYYSGVNNYHMPLVVRLDLGYNISFRTGKVGHELNLGVCNVLNRFNPFMLYYDVSSESWKELALLPIMPNFSYRITFGTL